MQIQKSEWYHLGIDCSISKSNLAYANEKRNWQTINQWISENDSLYQFDGVAWRLEPISLSTYHQEFAIGVNNTVNEDDLTDVKGHQHIKTLSVINEHLWQGHVWHGFGFAVDPNPHVIQSPVLYLMFDDRQTSIDIFKEWKENFGDKAGEKIKVSIQKGYRCWSSLLVQRLNRIKRRRRVEEKW